MACDIETFQDAACESGFTEGLSDAQFRAILLQLLCDIKERVDALVE